MNYLWVFFAVFTAFAWAVSYTAAEQVIKVIDKSSYIVISCVCSLVVFGFMARNHITGDVVKLYENPSILGWFLAGIIASGVGTYMCILAIETSSASLAASLEITYPFWCLLLAWILFGHRMSFLSMGGTVLIFVGVLVVVWGTKLPEST